MRVFVASVVAVFFGGAAALADKMPPPGPCDSMELGETCTTPEGVAGSCSERASERWSGDSWLIRRECLTHTQKAAGCAKPGDPCGRGGTCVEARAANAKRELSALLGCKLARSSNGRPIIEFSSEPETPAATPTATPKSTSKPRSALPFGVAILAFGIIATRQRARGIVIALPLLAVAALLVARVAAADIPRDPPRPQPDVQRPAPPEKPAQPSGKACGMGAGAALFAIGVFGAWRLSKAPTASREVAA